jgi:hypothetical protein
MPDLSGHPAAPRAHNQKIGRDAQRSRSTLTVANIRRSGRTSDPRPDHARWLAPIWARCASIRLIRGGFWTVRRSSAERADVVDLAPAGVTAVSLRRLAGWLPHRLSPPFGGKRILRTGGGTSSGSREPRSRRPASRSVTSWQAAPFTVCPRALRRGRHRRVYPPSWSAAAAAGRRWERTARSTLSATIPIVNHQL